MKRHQLLGLIASFAWAITGCGETAATGPQAPDTRVIVFSSDSGAVGGMSIFLMHADGSNKTRLSASGAFDQFPVWSPDGRTIAFDSDRLGGVTRVWAIDTDGSNPRILADGYGARWSPDGAALTYTGKTAQGLYVVFVANADGSSPKRLTTNLAGEVRPAWSPDGSKIVFSAYPDYGNMNLYVVAKDGTHQTQLTDTEGYSEDVAWSPDGAHIAFAHGANNALSAIHVIRPDGTDDRTLSDLGCGGPAWSSDARQLAFTCARDSRPQIYRMDSDGSHKLVLTAVGFSSVGASWKPEN